jgi:signal transduction histidine kinase
MRTRKWIPVLLPFAVGLLGTLLHWPAAARTESWGQVLASLYYIPIVIAAITLGTRPAIFVALAAAILYAFSAVLGRGEVWVQPAAETTLFVCVGLTAGELSQWLRTSAVRSALPKGSVPDELSKSFHDVQDSSQMSALSRVVLGLVRQFRTPLTSIEGAGWVLEHSSIPDEKRQEFVSIVRKESHRLNRVLADVLDFARPRKPRFETVDLSALIDEVIQLAGPKDHGPFFLFRKDIPPDFPPLRCDPEQIRQVLLNLAMNSIQATPGGGQIEISASVDKQTVLIRVKDHGRGIPADVMDKIFDPFFTTHESNLGLGLSVALHIVSEHRGKIIVEPDVDRGACIAVSLPLT